MAHIQNVWEKDSLTDRLVRQDCCGCTACEQVCGKSAIIMIEDMEGFLYPVVNEDICVDCGLCTKVCPVINKCESIAPYKASFASYSSDDKTLQMCATGGFATELSRLTIKQGGIVFGVSFSEDYVKAEYQVATTLDELKRFSGSKYVQSQKNDVFTQVRNTLVNNELVLFVGCPCDVAALKLFLRKDYDNLLTVELICMGVTSYKIAESYKEWAEKRYHSKITFLNARSKEKGWYVPHLETRFENGKKKIASLYGTYYGFGSQMFNRPSCYQCQYRSQTGVADIRIGDFWGIKQSDPYWNPKGVSVIYVRSEKGINYINHMKQAGFILQEVDYEVATLSNSSSYKNKDQKYVLLREKFAKEFLHGRGLPAACWRVASLGFVVKNVVPSSLHEYLKRVYHYFVDHKR